MEVNSTKTGIQYNINVISGNNIMKTVRVKLSSLVGRSSTKEEEDNRLSSKLACKCNSKQSRVQ